MIYADHFHSSLIATILASLPVHNNEISCPDRFLCSPFLFLACVKEWRYLDGLAWCVLSECSGRICAHDICGPLLPLVLLTGATAITTGWTLVSQTERGLTVS